MTNAKYNCASLLNMIGKMLNYKIQEQTIKNAFEYIEKCKDMIDSSNTQDNHLLKKLLAAQNSYSLVTYPVSYHHDIFYKNEHSLENKICA